MALQGDMPPHEEADDISEGQQKNDEAEMDAEDLEEGKVIDSGPESEEDTKEPKVPYLAKKNSKRSSNKRLKAAVLRESNTDDAAKVMPNSKNINSRKQFRKRPNKGHCSKFKNTKYVDHDRVSENEENGCEKFSQMSLSKNAREKEPVDYREELGHGLGIDGSLETVSKENKKRKSGPKKMSESKPEKQIEENRKLRKEGIISSTRKPYKYFGGGHCHEGTDGIYQHIPKPPKKTELCRYFKREGCLKMETCPFMHGEFPCKFFHAGGKKCFANEKCKFSHDPLTEQMKQILQDYLKPPQRADYHHEKPSKKREHSPIPDFPQNRTCPLDSPKRYRKEAGETKQWEEEMTHLQRVTQSDAFNIHLDANQMPLPHYQKGANFYKDLLSSPAKERTGPRKSDLGAMNLMLPTTGNLTNNMNNRFSRMSQNHSSKETVDWKNRQTLIHGTGAPQNNDAPTHQSYNESSVIKGELHSTSDFYLASSYSNDKLAIKSEDSKRFDDKNEDYRSLRINQGFGSGKEYFFPGQSMDESFSTHVSAECPILCPIIPNHLGRTEPEFTSYIQNDQELKAAENNDKIPVMEDKTGGKSDHEVLRVKETEDSNKNTTYDDSDEDDGRLIIVCPDLDMPPLQDESSRPMYRN